MAIVMAKWLVSAFVALAFPVQVDSSARLVLEDRDHLPLGFATSVLDRLVIAYHDDPSLAFAWYQPAPGAVESVSGDAIAAGGIVVPARLWLSREVFAAANSKLRVGELPIDVVENLVFALLLARLHDEVEAETEVGRWLRDRAARQAATSEAVDGELAANMMAIASFGSHLVSVANEIERIARRSRARGGRGESDRGVCRLIQDRVGIFSVWERAFDSEFLTSAIGARGETLRAVGAEGRRLVIDQVLRVSWTGDAAKDFGPRYCEKK